jgi:hypothetical protein
MAANTTPIFPLTPAIGWANLVTANTAKDGTGTVGTIFTAGANGGIVATLKARATGTNTASVLRIFINNGSTNATPANNSLYMELSLPGTTLTEVAAQNDLELLLNLPLPAGYKLNAVIGTTVAASWQITAVGGNY